MSEKISKEVVINTNQGEGIIESFFVSELDHLMVRIKHEDCWINYPIGNVNELLESKGIALATIDNLLF